MLYSKGGLQALKKKLRAKSLNAEKRIHEMFNAVHTLYRFSRLVSH